MSILNTNKMKFLMLVSVVGITTVSLFQNCSGQFVNLGSSLKGSSPVLPTFVQATSCLVEGQIIPHAGSITLYINSVVDSTQNCKTETRVCQNGVLSGSATFSSCSLKPVEICNSCLSIRLGRPKVIRGNSQIASSAPGGQSSDELDTTFPILKLKSGQFRGFSSNANVYTLDGPTPWGLAGSARRMVLPENKPKFFWMNSVFSWGTQTIGFVHQETDANYSIGQTFKRMDLAYSPDEGLTWAAPIQIISGMDLPTKGEIVGEGDCTAVLGPD